MGVAPQADLGTGDAERRRKTFLRLARRNRLVGILRWSIPGIGLLVAGVLVVQIILTNMARDYGISGLGIDKGQVIIDAPRYGGNLPDGSRYEVSAEVARVHIDATDMFDLEKARITITQPDGYQMVASAGEALLDLGRQTVRVPGLMQTRDSKNVTGELRDTLIDWNTQTLQADGPVAFDFSDGARIQGRSLTYDAASRSWDFAGAVYTVPGDGER